MKRNSWLSNRLLRFIVLCIAFLVPLTASYSVLGAAANSTATEVPALSISANPGGADPVLSGETYLQTITAVPWLSTVSDKTNALLEGTVFDRQGNLYFLDSFNSTVYKVTPEKKISTAFVTPKDLTPATIKISKDGRLFIAGLGDFKSTGSIVACNPDGSNMKVIIPPSAGYVIDELVFDNKGGFYFATVKGTPTEPTGGVYYMSPDFKNITPVLKNLCFPNGLVLSADQKMLIVTDMASGRLIRAELLSDGVTVAPAAQGGENIPYYFTGSPGPDSATIDSNGNIYVAMFMQGRVLVFNKMGFPIGQILIPGRETGSNLFSSHVAFIPGTDQMIICTSDGPGTPGGKGGRLFTARGFAKGAQEYQFQ